MFRTFMTAAILALTVTAAQAGDVTIHVGDLDLTRAQDTQMLASRVQAAAKTACTSEFGTHTGAITYNNAVIQSCVKQASKSAMTKYQTMNRGLSWLLRFLDRRANKVSPSVLPRGHAIPAVLIRETYDFCRSVS